LPDGSPLKRPPERSEGPPWHGVPLDATVKAVTPESQREFFIIIVNIWEQTVSHPKKIGRQSDGPYDCFLIAKRRLPLHC
jgi:hypothetical protein